MTDTTADNHAFDFDLAVVAYVDGSIADADLAALNDALRSDPALRRQFAARCRVIAELHDRHTAAPVAPAKPDAERQSGGRSVGISDTPSVPTTAAGVPMYRKGYEPQPFKLRPHHYALAAATLLAACGLAAYLLTTSVDPKPDPVDPNQSPTPVATLIHNTGNLRTPHGYPAEGDDYGRGEYSLDRGTAEFMLANAVNVKLRGDTRLRMYNNMNVALTRGTAEFVCPTDAKGFTVHIDRSVRVVDLGTRFTVNRDDDGDAGVRVTEGTVRIEHTDPDHPTPLVMEAGAICTIARTPDGDFRIVRFVHESLPLAAFSFDEGGKRSSVVLDDITTDPFDGVSLDADAAGVSSMTDCAFVRAVKAPGTEAEVLSADTYLRFTATAAAGHRLNLSELRLRFGCSRTRAEPWSHTLLVQSSVGGFGPDAPVVARIHRTATGPFGGKVLQYDEPQSLPLDDPDFAQRESIEFRFYFVSSDLKRDAVHRIDDLQLFGTVSSTDPDPDPPHPESPKIP